jgi:hypothetical protein
MQVVDAGGIKPGARLAPAVSSEELHAADGSVEVLDPGCILPVEWMSSKSWNE